MKIQNGVNSVNITLQYLVSSQYLIRIKPE